MKKLRAFVLVEAHVLLLSSCIFFTTGEFQEGRRVGSIVLSGSNPDALQVSSLAASRKNEGILWVASESSSLLYAFDSQGGNKGSLDLKDSTGKPLLSKGVKDVTVATGPDSAPYIYLIDGTITKGFTKSLLVYRIPEPLINHAESEVSRSFSPPSTNVTRFDIINLSIPKVSSDNVQTEMILVDPAVGEIIVTIKDTENELQSIYATLNWSTFVEGSFGEMLQPKGHLRHWQTTSGDVSPDATEVIISTPTGVFAYSRNETNLSETLADVAGFEELTHDVRVLHPGQPIAYATDDTGLYMTSDLIGSEQTLYFYPRIGVEYVETTPAPTVTTAPSSILGNIEYVGHNGEPPEAFPLQVCQGDCDTDLDCAGGLACRQRDEKDKEVVSLFCRGSPKDDPKGTDYCVPLEELQLVTYTPPSTSENSVDEADSMMLDIEWLIEDFESYNTSGINASIIEPFIPGLLTHMEQGLLLSSGLTARLIAQTGKPVAYDVCPNVTESVEQNLTATVLQLEKGDKPQLKMVGNNGLPLGAFPLGVCEGECDEDNDCQGHMVCWDRSQSENGTVPGCSSNSGEDDSLDLDFCVATNLNGTSTNLNGTSTAIQDNHCSSRAKFHIRPDFGATFEDSREGNEGGWIYVSNSESRDRGRGGVGAITFDRDGNVINYKRLLTGTTMNCGGGKTPWETWVSCEEIGGGKLYQVDPTGQRDPEIVELGDLGGEWESFAYDIRDRDEPQFFATQDMDEGILERYTPQREDVNWTTPETAWDMLHGDGRKDWLLLIPNKKDDNDKGTFEWTTDREKAKKSAKKFYPHSEGIDVRDGVLWFVCKNKQGLYELDLDNMTYQRHSTEHGLFDGTPDQIQRILKEGETDLMFFTEEGGKDAGIHGRDENGVFFTLLESPIYPDETTGLAFSPDAEHMYVAYQQAGLLFDITRQDKLPFSATAMELKVHATP